MSILFPVTGNGGSRSEANLQLKNVLAEHHLQYGFRAVNFVICPTATGGLEAPIEEWKREFAEFAEWSWEIKDSVGTMGMWRGQVAGGQVADEAMDLAPFAPATTATLAAIVVAAPVVGAPFAAAVAAHAFWRWIRRRDPPWRFWRSQSTGRFHAIPLPPKQIWSWSYFWKSSRYKKCSRYKNHRTPLLETLLEKWLHGICTAITCCEIIPGKTTLDFCMFPLDFWPVVCHWCESHPPHLTGPMSLQRCRELSRAILVVFDSHVHIQVVHRSNSTWQNRICDIRFYILYGAQVDAIYAI